jgi:hypothetical protein
MSKNIVVTHLTTNPPVRCLNRAERTGSLVFNVLWPYVENKSDNDRYNDSLYGRQLVPDVRSSPHNLQTIVPMSLFCQG